MPLAPTRPRILVVEDEFLIRLTLSEALEEEGFEVLEAETADAALPMLLADPVIRLLLTDIQLPGTLNGTTLAEKAREASPHLPVIFMSGRPDPSRKTDSAFETYISKPYTLTDICSAAKRMTAAA